MTRPIARRALPRRGALLASLAWATAAQSAQVALLATSAWLIARAAEQPPILYLGMAVVGVRAFAIGRAVFRYLERLTAHHSAFVALAELRVWIYRQLVPLMPAGLQYVGRGHVLNAFVRDVDTLQDFPLRVVQPVASALVVSTLTVAGFLLIDPASAGILAVALLTTVVVSVVWSRWVSDRAESRLSPARAALAEHVMDTLQRRAVLAAYGAEQRYHETATALDSEVEKVERKIVWGSAITASIGVALGGGAVAAIVFVAGSRVTGGDLSGPLFALLVLTPLAIFDIVQAVPGAVVAWRGVRSAEERIRQVIPEQIPPGIPPEREPDETDTGSALPVTELMLDTVSAAWPGQSATSKPLSVTLHRGDRLLVTGPSGVGKSTLAAALVGFVSYRGVIRLNGEDLEDMSLPARRRQIVLIEQSPHLFDTSIRHNLTFANPEATDAELLQVLAQVGLADWVHQRGGLDSPVGETGALVSGGQAQRIALARAFLTRARVLILDEPTANVDRQRADQLMDDLLRSVSEGSHDITIVISHVPVDESLVSQKVELEYAADGLAPTTTTDTAPGDQSLS